MKEEGNKLIYKDLSYQIIGIVFEVFNNLGFGYQEKIYQKALEIAFSRKRLQFVSQSPYKIRYKGEIVGRYFMDFVVEDKIVIELKQGNYFSRKNFEQVNAYLKATGYKLAILINFTSGGIKFKRMLNLQ